MSLINLIKFSPAVLKIKSLILSYSFHISAVGGATASEGKTNKMLVIRLLMIALPIPDHGCVFCSEEQEEQKAEGRY